MRNGMKSRDRRGLKIVDCSSLSRKETKLCRVQSQADEEWKFARSKLWISYFDDSGTLPAPFNTIPSPKTFYYILCWLKSKLCACSKQQKHNRWQSIKVNSHIKDTLFCRGSHIDSSITRVMRGCCCLHTDGFCPNLF